MVTCIKLKVFQFSKTKNSLFLFVFGCALSGCGSGSGSNTNQPQAGSRPAILSVSGGDVFDFGSQLVGSSTEQEFTVTNTGDKTATDISGTFNFSLSYSFKGGSYPGAGGTCGYTINPGAICSVIIIFNPRNIGQSQSVLELDYNDGSAPKATTVPVLSGRGI